MIQGRAPLSFFLKGLAALAVLFVFTLLLAPSQELNALRALIGVGAAIVCGKMLLRHFNIDWPPRRH